TVRSPLTAASPSEGKSCRTRRVVCDALSAPPRPESRATLQPSQGASGPEGSPNAHEFEAAFVRNPAETLVDESFSKAGGGRPPGNPLRACEGDSAGPEAAIRWEDARPGARPNRPHREPIRSRPEPVDTDAPGKACPGERPGNRSRTAIRVRRPRER